jgi:hypothetical protein
MKILEEMLRNKPSQHLQNVMAKSFHSAMQAKGILANAKYSVREEIFIAALLRHLGEMSLLSRDDELAHRLNHLISVQGKSPPAAAREVLGFGFDELTQGLVEQWQLSPVLLEVVKRQGSLSASARAVLLGEELSQVAALGWDSDPVLQVIKKISEFNGTLAEKVLEQAKSIADYAKEVSSMYGTDSVKHLIPPSTYTVAVAEQLPVITHQEIVEQTGETITCAELDITPDMIEAALNFRPLVSKPPASTEKGVHSELESQTEPTQSTGRTRVQTHRASLSQAEDEGGSNRCSEQLQTQYMKDLSKLLSASTLNVNDIFRIILDGMQEAVGLDRVVMCLVSRDRRTLHGKSFRGDMEPVFRTGFEFSLLDENAFSHALKQSQSLWLGSRMMAGKAYLVTEPIKKHLQCEQFFIAPIVVARKPIGVFYADQHISRAPLTEQQFVNFNSLAQQASLALSMTGK